MGGLPADLGRLRSAVVPVVAAVVTAAALAVSVAGPGGSRPVWPIGALLLAASVAVLVWRRVRPRLVLVASAAAAVVYYVGGFPPGPEVVPFVVALFTVAAGGRRVLAIGAAVAACVVAGSTDALLEQAEDPGDLIGVAATLAAVVALGEAHRARQAYFAQSRQRAVQEERLRIARELHDVLGHHLTVINLQAEAALARHATRPGLADTALSAISAASREALGDLRTTLGAIRDPGEAPVDPAPSLSDLPGLAERFRAAGTEVTATVPHPPATMPAAIERALVRIAQEALANAVRHARPRDVRLTVAYEPKAVLLDVVNDGADRVGAAPGSGIHSMRQRAEALGGSLRAEPADGGRFCVHARLPLRVTP
jgi:signal transduction histidine kinase